MPSLSNKVGIQITSDFDGKGVHQAEQAVSGFGGKMKSMFGTVASFAAGGLIANAISTIGGKIQEAGSSAIRTAAQLESSEAAMASLLKSTEKAQAVMARIKKEAAATPFEIPGLTEGVLALTTITKDGDKAIDTILDIGKAIAKSGKGQVEFDRVVANLQQVASVGTVFEQDIKEFRRAIPLFDDILAAAGLTAEELKNSANGADLLFEAFRKAGHEGGITADGFASQAGKYNQIVSNLNDTFTILGASIVVQSGLFDLLKQGLQSLNDFLTVHSEEITAFTAGVINFIGSSVSTVISFFQQTTASGQGFVSWLTGSAWPAIQTVLSNWSNAFKLVWNLLVIGFNAIKVVVDAFRWGWENNFLGMRSVLMAFWNIFKTIFNSISQSIATVMNLMAKAVNSLTKIPGFTGPTFSIGEFKAPTLPDISVPDYTGATAPINVGAINIYDSADYQSMLRDMSYVVNTR